MVIAAMLRSIVKKAMAMKNMPSAGRRTLPGNTSVTRREYYEPRLPCDATQIGRFRTAIDEAGVEEILKATLETAVAMKAVRPSEFERLIVDTTV